jgi:PTS system mannitol-specific IIC component
MNPKVIVAPILGNLAAIFWFALTGCGLQGPASPGSIIAFLAMTPTDTMVQTIIGVVLSAGISFAVASFLVRDVVSESEEPQALDTSHLAGVSKAPKIVFACDAGMGSSAMGATRFRNRIKTIRPDVTVEHASVDSVPADADIVVCQVVLSERVRKSAPQAKIVSIGNFLDDANLDALYDALAADNVSDSVAVAPALADTPKPTLLAQVLTPEGIKLGLPSVSREQAIAIPALYSSN